MRRRTARSTPPRACGPRGATSAAGRIRGAVTDSEYERGKMLVVMGAMQLWASGKLDEVEVDDEEE